MDAMTERLAGSSHGLSVIVGRQPGPRQAGAVYLLARLPREDHAHKAILGWEDSGSQLGGGTG